MATVPMLTLAGAREQAARQERIRTKALMRAVAALLRSYP